MKPDITCIDLTQWLNLVVQAVRVVIWNESELDRSMWLWCLRSTFKDHSGRPKWALSRHALQWTNVTALSKGPSPLELHRSHFWTKQQLWPYIALCPFHFILGKDFTFCTAKKCLLTNISPCLALEIGFFSLSLNCHTWLEISILKFFK